MFEASRPGILYTDYVRLYKATSLAGLWSYETRSRERNRQPVAVNAAGNTEYWLERSDPLLNTMLPGTHVSLVVNLGDPWAVGRSLVTSDFLPRLAVIGPATRMRILQTGWSVHALGAVVGPTLATTLFDVNIAELVDRIVPLHELWPRSEAEDLHDVVAVGRTDEALTFLRSRLLARLGESRVSTSVAHATTLIQQSGGRICVEGIAREHRQSRQRFAKIFRGGTGLTPKLYTRITRFQALIQSLLSTDVSRWATLAVAHGFYDQAHMDNEFRAFTGSAPTAFFLPRGSISPPSRLRGKPSDWFRAP